MVDQDQDALGQARPTDPRFRRTVVHPRLGPVDEVFCVSCGHHGGYVLKETPTVIHICAADRGCGCNCLKRFGGLPIRKVSEAVMAHYQQKED